jgi:Arc/MetJ-type ribon-helix-helix transcriptional regulator
MSAKDEEIKIRVPGAMKSAIKALASKRYTSESEIAREALLEYLRNRNVELREEPTPYKTEPAISSDRKAELDAEVENFVKGTISDSKKQKKKPQKT